MSVSIGDIRSLLLKGGKFSPAEIVEALGLSTGSKEEKNRVYGAIRQGVMSGMFTRHHSPDGLSYTFNADYKPGRPGPKQTSSSRPAGPKSEVLVTPRPMLENVHAPAPASAYHAPAAISSTIAKSSDFDLRRRLDAIGSDIADAIADACDAEHPHSLIKALVVSREAVSRAQAVLPR